MALRSAPVRVLLVLVVVLFAAGCGDDESSDTSTTASNTSEPTATDSGGSATTSSTAATGAAAGIEVADSDLGKILTSGGMTLYLFTADTDGTSTCYDSCADTWPPLLSEGDVEVGDGLDDSLFGTVARDEGGMQVTVDGAPLYFYANDAAAGDTNGQGIGDSWFVVGTDGAAIKGG